MKFWLTDKAWKDQIRGIRAAYPGTRWEGIATAEGCPTRRLWVPIRPVPDKQEFAQVVADLYAGHVVGISTGGQLSHDLSECGGVHRTVPLADNFYLEPTSFEVVVTLPPVPYGEAGPCHPRAETIRPLLDAKRLAGHPHFYGGLNGSAYACPITPQSTSWSWDSSGILGYLDQLSIWLLKTCIWFEAKVWLDRTQGMTRGNCWCPSAQTAHAGARLA